MRYFIKLTLILVISFFSIYLSQKWVNLINQWLSDQTPRPTQWENFREEVKSIEQNRYFPIDRGINLIVLAVSILLFFGILLNLKIKDVPNNILLSFYVLILFFVVWDIITPVIDFTRGILPTTWDTIFIPIFHSLLINTILFSIFYWWLMRRVKKLWQQTQIMILIIYSLFFGAALWYFSSRLTSIIVWWWIWWPMYFNYPKLILWIMISMIWIYYTIKIIYSKIPQKTLRTLQTL